MKDLYRTVFLVSIRILIYYFHGIFHNLYVENGVYNIFVR